MTPLRRRYVTVRAIGRGAGRGLLGDGGQPASAVGAATITGVTDFDGPVRAVAERLDGVCPPFAVVPDPARCIGMRSSVDHLVLHGPVPGGVNRGAVRAGQADVKEELVGEFSHRWPTSFAVHQRDSSSTILGLGRGLRRRIAAGSLLLETHTTLRQINVD